jgi:hypothetical protein
MCMLLSFQRPPRLAWGDSPKSCAPRSYRLQSGQWSLAHPPRKVDPRLAGRPSGSTAARNSSTLRASLKGLPGEYA